MFVKLGIVVYYECNKQYIAANLCENRTRPELNCCGKCYLKKQLVRADNGNQDNNGKQVPAKWRMGDYFVYILPSALVVHLSVPEQRSGQFASRQAFNLQFFYKSVFHPPLVEMV
jgi:hypothetical protein